MKFWQILEEAASLYLTPNHWLYEPGASLNHHGESLNNEDKNIRAELSDAQEMKTPGSELLDLNVPKFKSILDLPSV